jgi:hypothetical protein
VFRPVDLHPKGFVVAILDDTDHAEQAKTSLTKAGFAEGHLRVYTSEEILDSREQFLAQRSLAGRVVGALTEDTEAIKLYYGYARAGSAALWVYVPDDDDANRAVRHLADHHVLHLRHYGHSSQEDITPGGLHPGHRHDHRPSRREGPHLQRSRAAVNVHRRRRLVERSDPRLAQNSWKGHTELVDDVAPIVGTRVDRRRRRHRAWPVRERSGGRCPSSP